MSDREDKILEVMNRLGLEKVENGLLTFTVLGKSGMPLWNGNKNDTTDQVGRNKKEVKNPSRN